MDGPLRPTLTPFRTVARSNHARSSRRFLLARYLDSRDDTVDVVGDAVHHVEPSDDEGLLAEGQEEILHRVLTLA